ncbi:MAG: putative RNA methyltransferase [Acutalibacteraceae bacterium]
MYFICPVCKEKLELTDRTYKCKNNHCFDKSKDGYVNLLMSQKSSEKRHGDDKIMVKARRDFLEKGYYKPLLNEICSVLRELVKTQDILLDIGCGEGYYTKSISDATNCEVIGIDISKAALKYAAKSMKECQFAVASAFSLPFESNSADFILNIFAPCPYQEFKRVLKSNGKLIKVVPLEEHLWELKCALYNEPYKNKPEQKDEVLFTPEYEKELKYKIDIENGNDIENLFKMTPYYYKTSREDAEKLLSLNKLTTTVHFNIEVYKINE